MPVTRIIELEIEVEIDNDLTDADEIAEAMKTEMLAACANITAFRTGVSLESVESDVASA